MPAHTILTLPYALQLIIVEHVSDIYSVVALVSFDQYRSAFERCADRVFNNILNQWPPQIRCLVHATLVARLNGAADARKDMQSFCETYLDQVQEVRFKAEGVEPLRALQVFADLVSETESLADMWRLSSLKRLQALLNPLPRHPDSHEQQFSATELYRVNRAFWRLQLYAELFQSTWTRDRPWGRDVPFDFQPQFEMGEEQLAVRVDEFGADEMQSVLWFLRFAAEVLIQAASGYMETYRKEDLRFDCTRTDRLFTQCTLSSRFEFAGGTKSSLLWRLGFFDKLYSHLDLKCARFTTAGWGAREYLPIHPFHYKPKCPVVWPEHHGAHVKSPTTAILEAWWVRGPMASESCIWTNTAFFIWDAKRLGRHGVRDLEELGYDLIDLDNTDINPLRDWVVKAREKERNDMENDFRRYFSAMVHGSSRVLKIPQKLEALLGRPYTMPGESPVWEREQESERLPYFRSNGSEVVLFGELSVKKEKTWKKISPLYKRWGTRA